MVVSVVGRTIVVLGIIAAPFVLAKQDTSGPKQLSLTLLWLDKSFHGNSSSSSSSRDGTNRPGGHRQKRQTLKPVDLSLLQIRDHLSKVPSEDSSDAFCGVENGSIRYPIHSCMRYHRNSARAQRRKSRQATHELMTPSVSIYLMTNTLLKMPSIHISFSPPTHQRIMREERGTNASHQPFPHMFVLFCCFWLFGCCGGSSN